MRCPKWVTAQDLDRWAATPAGKLMLPELLRRLVRATVALEHLKKLDFPSEAETHRPGYDGTTVTAQGTLYVPEGVGFWELGSEVNKQKGKADGDYENRIREHEESVARGETADIAQATYIAVTALDWQGATKWAEARTAERRFKAVAAYDSNRLEQWIWEASAVGLWLAQVIHGRLDGVWDVQSHWEGVQATLNRPIPPDVLLVNRTKTASMFEQWLGSPSGVLAVKAPSREELVDFFCAWVKSLPPAQEEEVLSRAIIVENRDAWRSLATSRNPLILIAAPRLDGDKDLFGLASRDHHVLHFATFTSSRSSGAVEMERMRRFDLQQALKKAGMAEADAAKTAEAAGGNFTILRRLLARTAEDKTPAWGSDGALAPLLLAGAWKNENPHDQQAVADISGRPYAEVQTTLTKWWREPDQPVRLVDGTWEFLSPVDAWQVLHPSLTLPHLDALHRIALTVLGENNPSFDLPPEERVMASFKGKTRLYSAELRHGLAEVLALGASREEESCIGQTHHFAERVTKIVRELLPEGCDWKRWASLGDVLPQLIEAAPVTVIEAIERDVRGASPALAELMRQEIPPGSLSGAAYHSGVLWTLERAAWSPSFFPRVSLLLARLDDLDPGGKWANRPRGSLCSLFFSWRPQTMASVRERLDTVSLLIKKTPASAWNLLLSLFPRAHETIADNGTPSYRDWAAGWTGEVTLGDYRSYISEISELSLSMTEEMPTRWLELIEDINLLATQFPDLFTKVCGRFETFVNAGVPIDLRGPLWEKLRALIQKNTQFNNAWWALPPSDVARLAILRDKLEPQSSIITLKPLFDDSGMWNDKTSSYEQQIEKLAKERRIAIRTIWDEGGLPLVLEFAKSVRQAWDVGRALAEELRSAPQDAIIPALLTNEDVAMRNCANAYTAIRISEEGPDWAESLPTSTWTQEQIAALAQQMRVQPRTWDWVSRMGAIADNLYWENATVWAAHDLPQDSALRAVARLQAVGRAWSALDILATRLHKKIELHPDAYCDALEAILSSPLERQNGVMDAYHAQQIFAFLQNSPAVDTSRVARLEFGFLPILDQHSLLPRTLHRELARNPTFFVDCLMLLYRPHSAPKEDTEETPPDDRKAKEDVAKAEKAKRLWQLLHDWQTVPGSDTEGKVDLEALRRWVEEARQMAGRADRLIVCDIQIGQIFARSNEDEFDKAKPVVPIREVIEETESEHIERGFIIGLHNLRGAHWKGMYDGGAQERELAAIYNRYADACARWPRTSAALRNVAGSYLKEAEIEDERAKARE